MPVASPRVRWYNHYSSLEEGTDGVLSSAATALTFCAVGSGWSEDVYPKTGLEFCVNLPVAGSRLRTWRSEELRISARLQRAKAGVRESTLSSPAEASSARGWSEKEGTVSGRRVETRKDKIRSLTKAGIATALSK